MRVGDIFCVISLIFSRQNVAKVALQTAFKPKYNARFEPSFAREPLVCHFDKFVAIFIQIRHYFHTNSRFFSYKFVAVFILIRDFFHTNSPLFSFGSFLRSLAKARLISPNLPILMSCFCHLRTKFLHHRDKLLPATSTNF